MPIRLAMQREIRHFPSDTDEKCQILTEFAEATMPEEDEKPGEVRFTPSLAMWKYLGWLVRNTVLGKTENEVAKQVLTDRLAEMRQEDYRDHLRP